MSNRNYLSREVGRHYTDPTSSRFDNRSRYHQRGRGRGNNRPVPNRPPTGGDELDTITVSINRNLTTDGVNIGGPSRGRLVRQRPGPRPIHPMGGGRFNDRINSEVKWWRVSIPQAGTIGKDLVMSTLKAHFTRQLLPYHVN